jgi:hypothetical protein
MTITNFPTSGTLFPDDDAMSPKLRAAVAAMSNAGHEERGAVFTRREVVDFILDLVGYRIDRPLHTLRLLEPSFGGGSFLLPAVERLLAAYARSAPRGGIVTALRHAVTAVEIHARSIDGVRDKLDAVLNRVGIEPADRAALLDAWLVQGDFLLERLEGPFDFVVGNPPYVRQELIPAVLLEEYRRRYATIYDRADIYVPFIERSLAMLSPGGALGFICADRWMKNRYGGPLRRMVAGGFHLRCYVDMVDTAAFDSDVTAYPAIFVIGRERGRVTRVAHRPQVNAALLADLAGEINGDQRATGMVREMEAVTQGDAPWLLDTSPQLGLVRHLEADYPTIEDAGCRIGIGVATGADKVFIAPFATLDVEDDRKLPLATTRDITDGTVKWRGLGVINPFTEDGDLVPLANYPRLARYLEAHGQAIRARHVSKRDPSRWYRTIDRITPALAQTPKLLIPDIKGEAHIVYEPGKLYPHHNLYFITSGEWDLHALQAVLLSGVARLFIATYSTKMRGGFLRFQAQYLRRIRLPHWGSLDEAVRRELRAAGLAGDPTACNAAVAHAYGLTEAEQAVLMGRKGMTVHVD